MYGFELIYQQPDCDDNWEENFYSGRSQICQ